MARMEELQARRNEIVKEIEGIQSMRKGTLNATYKNVTHKDGKTVLKGPYYKLSRKGQGNKTISWSVPAKEATHIKAEVDNYKRFRELTDEYTSVCEEISVLFMTQPQNDVKKTEHSGYR